jgi:hypothetical protein
MDGITSAIESPFSGPNGTVLGTARPRYGMHVLAARHSLPQVCKDPAVSLWENALLSKAPRLY